MMMKGNYREKGMQTNKKEKSHAKPLKSRNRMSVSPANIFGSFFFSLIEFHILRADAVFKVDGLCLSITHFFLSCANKPLQQELQCCT